MLKKFNESEHLGTLAPLKSSIVKNYRASIIEQMPSLESVIGQVIPKKAKITLAKLSIEDMPKTSILFINKLPCFFVQKKKLIPTLQFIHRFHNCVPIVKTDQGACRPVIDGSDIMVPGLKNANSTLPDGLERGQIVAISAKDKMSAMAVGIMNMSSDEINDANHGNAITNIDHLASGFWAAFPPSNKDTQPVATTSTE